MKPKVYIYNSYPNGHGPLNPVETRVVPEADYDALAARLAEWERTALQQQETLRCQAAENGELKARLAEAERVMEKMAEHGDAHDALAARLAEVEPLLRELYDCGAVTNWMRVSDDLRRRVTVALLPRTADSASAQESVTP